MRRVACLFVCSTALASACTPLQSLKPKRSTSDTSAEDTAVSDATPPGALPDTGPVDTADVSGPEVDVSTAAPTETTDDWIFTLDRIHTIELELPLDSWNALGVDPYTYVPGSFTFDGERVDEVGLRLRGKIGSFRTLAGKPKLKVDFNRILDDQRFHGLESISLNNTVGDCGYIKEVVASRLYADAGIPTSRTSYARVYINGADYGLYIVVETQDDRFLDRYMADPSGNLYDGKYIWYGGSSYTLLDFAEGNDSLFQLEEGENVENAEIVAVSDALATWRGTDEFYAQLGALVDWEAIHRTWAVEQWLGQNDGYCLNKNNYRLYFSPDDGRMRYIPWDNDLTFLYDYQWGRSWSAPYGNLAAACLGHAECRADWAAAVDQLLSEIDPVTLGDFIAQIDLLTAESAATDPRRECDAASVAPSRAQVAAWLNTRSSEVRAAWGL